MWLVANGEWLIIGVASSSLELLEIASLLELDSAMEELLWILLLDLIVLELLALELDETATLELLALLLELGDVVTEP